MGRYKKPESAADEKYHMTNKQPFDFPEQMIPLEKPNKAQTVNGSKPQHRDATQPNATVEPKGVAHPNVVAEPKDVAQPNIVVESKDVVQPNVVVGAKGVAQPSTTVESESVIQPGITGVPKSAGGMPQYKAYIPKPLMVDTKLTIILVENTEGVVKEKGKLEMLVKNIVTTGYVLVINYGRIVRQGKGIDVKKFDCSDLVYEKYAKNDACLYDAIIALEDLVEKYYKKTDENKLRRMITRINSIEIIGIGRCVDNCSITSSQIAEESFGKIAKYIDVTTKYFCLTEESFVNAARIGFHSIGAINRNYM